MFHKGQKDKLIPNSRLYIGMTDDLAERVMQHKQKYVKGVTQRYDIYTLAYTEAFESLEDAQANEYRMKRWGRAWKLELIESINPNWEDLSYTL